MNKELCTKLVELLEVMPSRETPFHEMCGLSVEDAKIIEVEDKKLAARRIRALLADDPNWRTVQ